MNDSRKVVQSAPPKKLSEWFISSDNSKLEEVNVWCFDQETAYEILVQSQLQESNLEIQPIKF